MFDTPASKLVAIISVFFLLISTVSVFLDKMLCREVKIAPAAQIYIALDITSFSVQSALNSVSSFQVIKNLPNKKIRLS